mgnify:FL=1
MSMFLLVELRLCGKSTFVSCEGAKVAKRKAYIDKQDEQDTMLVQNSIYRYKKRALPKSVSFFAPFASSREINNYITRNMPQKAESMAAVFAAKSTFKFHYPN